MATRFDAQLSIHELDNVELDAYQKSRLMQKRPLVTNANLGNSVKLRTLLDEDRLLEVRMNTVAEQQAQATAYLLLEDSLRANTSIEEFLAQVQLIFVIHCRW